MDVEDLQDHTGGSLENEPSDPPQHEPTPKPRYRLIQVIQAMNTLPNRQLQKSTMYYLSKMVPPQRHSSIVRKTVSPSIHLELLGQVAATKDADHGVYF